MSEKSNVSLLILHVEKSKFLYHATENAANQNIGKPLYIRRYYIQPSHHAPRVCLIDCIGHFIFYVMV